MNKIIEFPFLIGVARDGYERLFGIEDVADFICKKGLMGDVKIFTPYGKEVLNTFGIYIDRICDMEYKEELLKVLIPKQQNLF